MLTILLGSLHCPTTWAGDGTNGDPVNNDLNVTDALLAGGQIAITGNNGLDGTHMESSSDTRPSKGGQGGDVTVTAVSNSSLSNNIDIKVASGQGGKGGNAYTNTGSTYYSGLAYGGNTGDSGNAKVELTVQGDDITHQKVTIYTQSTNGLNGSESSGSGNVNIPLTNADNGNGKAGSGGNAETMIRIHSQNYTAADITLTASAGWGGHGNLTLPSGYKDDLDHYFANVDRDNFSIGSGGDGGQATAVGLLLDSSSTMVNTVVAGNVKINAYGGYGGNGKIDSIGGQGGQAGHADAYGVKTAASLSQDIAIQVKNILITTQAGDGGSHTSMSITENIKAGNVGGIAHSYAMYNQAAATTITAEQGLQASAKGGRGGHGMQGMYTTDTAGRQGGSGGDGGLAVATGAYNAGGNLTINAKNIDVLAIGGDGQKGGNGSPDSANTLGSWVGKGGNGGRGGDAIASVVHNLSGTTTVTADTLWGEAKAGRGGDGGYGGTSNRNPGEHNIAGNVYIYGLRANGGSIHSYVDLFDIIAKRINSQADDIGELNQAYGVYADGGSTIHLYEKTAGNGIKLDIKSEGAQLNEAYSIYADNASVLLHNNTTVTDNSAITYLNNSTLGFAGDTAARTYTGGVVNLQGSNTLVFNTDLTCGTPAADKLTFDSLASSSSSATQYITVGYDPAVDPVGTSYIGVKDGGVVEVLEIKELNGKTLSNFAARTNTIDSSLYKYNITPDININNNKIEISGIHVNKTDTPSEGLMAVSDVRVGLHNIWRVQGNNLMKRMGELRSDPEAAKGGVWARHYRGQNSAASSYGRSLEQDYSAFQGGIDKVQTYKSGRLYTGIAISHIDGNEVFSSGRGEADSTGIALYTSWLGDKGHYADLILRVSKLNSSYQLTDTSSKTISADYSSWAYGLSAEYGYRHKLRAGWFVEPQAELSFGHLTSANYTMSNGVNVEAGSINSLTARLGFVLGREFSTAKRPGNVYIKASLLHEFGGEGSINGYFDRDRVQTDGTPSMGTWCEVGVGTNLGIAKNSNIYLDAFKTFGSKINTKWQINAGIRGSF